MLSKLFETIQKSAFPTSINVDGLDYILGAYNRIPDEDVDIAEDEAREASFEAQTKQSEYEIKKIEKNINDLISPKTFTYKSIDSFIGQIRHSVMAQKHNPKDMHIVLTSTGGIFYPNFNDQKDKYEYVRSVEEVFMALQELKKKRDYSHKQLLTFLLENRTYILDFPQTFNSFKKIKNSKTVKFDTEPIVTVENGSEEYRVIQSYEFDGKIRKEELTLIPEIQLKMPVIENCPIKYEYTIYVTPMRGAEGEIYFELFAPALNELKRKAILDEYDHLNHCIYDVMGDLQPENSPYIGLSV